MSTPKTDWYKDQYQVSTDRSLLDSKAINAAFDSDEIYWCNGIKDETLLQKMLDRSLCYGLYVGPDSTSQNLAPLKQIGLARLISDEVTFAYLTDVYVLPDYQGKGLGKWLIKCVDESLSNWPELRRAMLITKKDSTFYADTLGMKEFDAGPYGVAVFTRRGPGSMV